MIKDRGIIKWQGMMLTEHNVEIKSWKARDTYIDRPQFDEWELEAIQMEMELAFKRQCDANVTIWRSGKTVSYIGKITKLDHRLQSISVEGPFGRDRISVMDIIKVDSMY